MVHRSSNIKLVYSYILYFPMRLKDRNYHLSCVYTTLWKFKVLSLDAMKTSRKINVTINDIFFKASKLKEVWFLYERVYKTNN